MMKKAIPILALLLSICLGFTSLPPKASAATNYNDVDRNRYEWALSAIDFMATRGVIDANPPNGRFNPSRPVTKAELTAMIHRLFDLYRPNRDAEQKIPPFFDVPETHWAYPYITDIYDTKFLNVGLFKDPKTLRQLFQPNREVSRLQFADFMDIYFDGVLMDSSLSSNTVCSMLFSMKDIPQKLLTSQTELNRIVSLEGRYWADGKAMDLSMIGKELPLLFNIDDNGNCQIIDGFSKSLSLSIASLHNQGILTADSHGKFRPKADITRAEVVTVLYRIFEVMSEKGILSTYSSFPPIEKQSEDSGEGLRVLEGDRFDNLGRLTKDLMKDGPIVTKLNTSGYAQMSLMMTSMEKVDLSVTLVGVGEGFLRMEELPITISLNGATEVTIVSQIRNPNSIKPDEQLKATLQLKLLE